MRSFIINDVIDYLHIIEIFRCHVLLVQVFCYDLSHLIFLACMIELNRSLGSSIQLDKHHWVTNDALLGRICLKEALHVKIPVNQFIVSEAIEVEINIVVSYQLLLISLQVIAFLILFLEA